MSGYGKVLVLTFLVGSLVSVDDAHADTIEATGCSQEEVQNAIDAAREGDIVAVPAGTATWTTTSSTKPAVLISEKTITLQGAGIDKTIIIDGTGHAWKDLLLWISGAKPSHIKEARDFHNDTARPGYRPYAYPHPLRAEWPPAPPKDHQAPTVPKNLTARGVSRAQAELTWEPSSDDEGGMGYYVWLDGAKVSAITDPACTKYTFLRLKPPLEQHTFRVSAFDAAGNESEPSSPARTDGS